MTTTERQLYRLIADNVSRLRLRRSPRISQAELADEIGVSRVSIVNFEAGVQAMPLLRLYQIASALDVEITEIIPTVEEFVKELIKVHA